MFIQTNFKGGGIGCLIAGILGLVAAYYSLKLLWWAAPFLFVLTLLINWRVVADAGKALVNLFRTRPAAGLIAAVLSVVAFPILALFLFLSAVGTRRAGAPQPGGFGRRAADNRKAASLEGEFIDFEEIESRPKTPVSREEPLEPPQQAEKQGPQKPGNPYDELFNS